MAKFVQCERPTDDGKDEVWINLEEIRSVIVKKDRAGKPYRIAFCFEHNYYLEFDAGQGAEEALKAFQEYALPQK